ncbi:hypothetical protein BJ742DRAFT_848001 [Cladochytrium replicatum]|nr:hypothetical protein BJ742DRAFT_848001 [Cladochytrium replicatum]
MTRRRPIRPAWTICAMNLPISMITIALLAGVLAFSSAADAACAKTSVRREWRTLTDAEQQQYVTAVKTLFAQPSKMGLDSVHTDLVQVHLQVAQDTHMTNLFLPWHRYYTLMFERLIQGVDPEIKGLPYWDWMMDSQDVTLSQVWKDFGGGGVEEADVPEAMRGCITSGPWSYLRGALPQASCIKRVSHPGVLPSLDLYSHLIISNTDYTKFRLKMETAHNTVHGELGGDYVNSMARYYSPNDPIFWPHHAQIDRIYTLWQQKHVGVADFPELDTIIDLGVYNINGESVTVRDILDSKQLCYEYAPSILPIIEGVTEASTAVAGVRPLVPQHAAHNKSPYFVGELPTIIPPMPFQRPDPSTRTSFREHLAVRKPAYRPQANRPQQQRLVGLGRPSAISKFVLNSARTVDHYRHAIVPTLDESSLPGAAPPSSETAWDRPSFDSKIKSVDPLPSAWGRNNKHWDEEIVRSVEGEFDRFVTYLNSIDGFESLCSLHNVQRAKGYRQRSVEEDQLIWDVYGRISSKFVEVEKSVFGDSVTD